MKRWSALAMLVCWLGSVGCKGSTESDAPKDDKAKAGSEKTEKKKSKDDQSAGDTPKAGECAKGFEKKTFKGTGGPDVKVTVCVKLPDGCKWELDDSNTVRPDCSKGDLAAGGIVSHDGDEDSDWSDCLKHIEDDVKSPKAKVTDKGDSPNKDLHWVLYKNGDGRMQMDSCVKGKKRVVDCNMRYRNDVEPDKDVGLLQLCKNLSVID